MQQLNTAAGTPLHPQGTPHQTTTPSSATTPTGTTKPLLARIQRAGRHPHGSSHRSMAYAAHFSFHHFTTYNTTTDTPAPTQLLDQTA
ncbi:hypothetical protein Pmani_027489 [Petrolisthes manimaculis]|uniref:Uncharacterized protein n=1 Tax=Petrolisthes manimaculis TaxID=1843537 RepID=A0AAE1TZ04_9EUCA|nr:hypothetical protein Pmani_027489 [Petrolisthes manimaculis]